MSNALMAPRKNKRSEASKAIAQAIIDQYQPASAEDMQDALRDIFGPMFEAMLQGEMNSHLGYETNDHGYKETSNRRNGYTHKSLKTTMGEVEIDTPCDRDGSFAPQLIPKRSKDVSGIEDKVLSMYARGMSQIQLVHPLCYAIKIFCRETVLIIHTPNLSSVNPIFMDISFRHTNDPHGLRGARFNFNQNHILINWIILYQTFKPLKI